MIIQRHLKFSSGFTLVEVLVSMGVFSIVVITGFAALSQLLAQQSETYARVRAASLAMRAANLYMHALSTTTTPSPHPVHSATDPNQLFIVPVTPPTTTDTYVGGTPADYRSGGSWYLPSDATLNNGDYDDLMVYLSPPSTEANEFMKYAYMTLWMVDRNSFTLNAGTSVRRLKFLGRYTMVVDRAP